MRIASLFLVKMSCDSTREEVWRKRREKKEKKNSKECESLIHKRVGWGWKKREEVQKARMGFKWKLDHLRTTGQPLVEMPNRRQTSLSDWSTDRNSNAHLDVLNQSFNQLSARRAFERGSSPPLSCRETSVGSLALSFHLASTKQRIVISLCSHRNVWNQFPNERKFNWDFGRKCPAQNSNAPSSGSRLVDTDSMHSVRALEDDCDFRQSYMKF